MRYFTFVFCIVLVIGGNVVLGAENAVSFSDQAQETPTSGIVSNVESSEQLTIQKETGQAQTIPENEKLICKYEKVTGSNLRKKICRTKEQIEETRKATRNMLEEATTKAPASFGKQ